VCDTGYSVKRLAEDLGRLKARGEPEAAMLEEVRGRVKELLLMKHNWLRSRMCVPGAAHLLHEEEDHSLAVFVFAAAAGEESSPHDHGTWVVIAGLDGWQTNHRWKRVDGELVAEGSGRIDSNAIVALPAGSIHSMLNDSGAVAVTLHVYGMHPDYVRK